VTKRGSADVVLASDRGFLAVSDSGQPVQRAGSLVDTLKAVARSLEGTVGWVATTSSAADARAIEEGRYATLAGDPHLVLDAAVVDHRRYRAYYESAGVRMLWFAHHELWREFSGTSVDPTVMADYEAVNEQVAGRVARLCRPGTPVVFQDYQLSCAPAFLRRLLPKQPIAHFTHTPFGPPSAFETLPANVLQAVVDGMLGADLLGFQRRRWAENFMDCCAALGLGVDPERGYVDQGCRRTWVRCYPLTIDVDDLAQRVGEPLVSGGLQLLRVDRLDPSKNLIRGFQAFERLLDRHSRWQGRVTFTAMLVPSRGDVPEYRLYAERMRDEVRRINGRYPGAVRLDEENSRQQALTALRGYDVLLVNPLRDGMNLVAQEGAALNRVNGRLVISDGAGSADILRDGALVIDDPTSVSETADLLDRALAMSEPESSRRAEAMREALADRGPGTWMAAQLSDLRSVWSERRPVSSP
jgi:trehalose 6-phosphate synthase